MQPRNCTGREVVVVGFLLGSMASQAWGVARLVVRMNSFLLCRSYSNQIAVGFHTQVSATVACGNLYSSGHRGLQILLLIILYIEDCGLLFSLVSSHGTIQYQESQSLGKRTLGQIQPVIRILCLKCFDQQGLTLKSALTETQRFIGNKDFKFLLPPFLSIHKLY